MSSLLIEIQNLTKRYHTKTMVVEALKGITLSIFKGEILCLLGVNGAGKTTLSSLIATLHPASSGDILYDNNSIYNDLIGFRKLLGYCPQKPNFEKLLTVEENLIFAGRYYSLPKEIISQRVALLMEQFELTKYAESLPEVLSGGYKQRLLIARALIHNPALIILDEPTVGMDPHIRRELWQKIKELKNQGVTVLLTTHYLDEAEILSDRVCILDKGLIKLTGTPESLKATYKKENLEDVFLQFIEENK